MKLIGHTGEYSSSRFSHSGMLVEMTRDEWNMCNGIGEYGLDGLKLTPELIEAVKGVRWSLKESLKEVARLFGLELVPIEKKQ